MLTINSTLIAADAEMARRMKVSFAKTDVSHGGKPGGGKAIVADRGKLARIGVSFPVFRAALRARGRESLRNQGYWVHALMTPKRLLMPLVRRPLFPRLGVARHGLELLDNR